MVVVYASEDERMSKIAVVLSGLAKLQGPTVGRGMEGVSVAAGWGPEGSWSSGTVCG